MSVLVTLQRKGRAERKRPRERRREEEEFMTNQRKKREKISSTLKGSALPLRCFQLLWLIRPVRLKLGGAVLELHNITHVYVQE